jgi:hypothetical protein
MNEPSLSDMAKSLWQATASFTRAGFPVTDIEEFTRRLSICKGCPHWSRQGFASTGKCRLCGCATAVKLRLATASCPAGKWSAAN